MVQGKINTGRHINHPAVCNSIRTKQCPPPPSPHCLLPYVFLQLATVHLLLCCVTYCNFLNLFCRICMTSFICRASRSKRLCAETSIPGYCVTKLSSECFTSLLVLHGCKLLWNILAYFVLCSDHRWGLEWETQTCIAVLGLFQFSGWGAVRIILASASSWLSLMLWHHWLDDRNVSQPVRKHARVLL